jgi:NitT/TauT family transport system permease protein
VPKKAAVVLGLVPILLLVGLWWYATRGEVEYRGIGPQILPSPAEVIESLPLLIRAPDPEHQIDGRDLPIHLLASLKRVGEGFLVALLVVLPLGVLMGAFGAVRAALTPLTTASGYIPIATLVPLTMSWWGIDEEQKVYFLAIAFGIFLLPQIILAIENVPGVYLRTAYTLGASRRQVVFRVLVPIALPDIWHAMRLAFGVGWTYLVLTEVVVMTDGLGFLVAVSQRRGPREHIYLVILLITLIAWVFDFTWALLGRLLFPYYQRSRA